jgi:flagellar basal-body rod protein FlgB
MLKIALFDRTKIPLLEKALDAYALRQRAIASNIANVSTLGYRRLEVKFEEELRNSMRDDQLKGFRTNRRHIPIGARDINEVSPEVVREGSPLNNDPLASGVNNVDIDYEMVELAKNQIRYRLASRLIAGAFQSIRRSIKGGDR